MKKADESLKPELTSSFPYESRYLDVMGSKMHYIEGGAGDPILFLHGNPTSSYLWRNIIPYLEPLSRCLAVDLIGMGNSDKPDIDYRFLDHVRYLEAFIEKMELRNLTIVGHDWGGSLGFYYAMRHELNMKAIAFMETLTKPLRWRDLGIVDRFVMRMLRHPVTGPKMVIQNNFFVEKVLPMLTRRNLSHEEMTAYRKPFLHVNSRKPVSVWPREIPLDGEPEDVYSIMSSCRNKLELSVIPKLLIWGKPGFLIRQETVHELKRSLKNLGIVNVGRAKHYLPEDQPQRIGEALAAWYQKVQPVKT